MDSDMDRLAYLFLLLLIIGCKKSGDATTVSSCSLSDSISVETEMPVPVYSFTLEYEGCDESVALFRENRNISGDIDIRLSDAEMTVTISVENNSGSAPYQDQDFSVLDGEFLLGTGTIVGGVAYVTSYAPMDAPFYYRLFDKDGWISAYESSQDSFCRTATNTISRNSPEIVTAPFDNDDGWGEDIILNYTFDSDTGAYSGCIEGIDGPYTVAWSVNGGPSEISDEFVIDIESVRGIHFVSATIYYRLQNVTLSHSILNDPAARGVVRRARIRRGKRG